MTLLTQFLSLESYKQPIEYQLQIVNKGGFNKLNFSEIWINAVKMQG
jgi:hypothetical protein